MYNLAWADEAHHRVTQGSAEFIFLEFKLIKLCGTVLLCGEFNALPP